MVKFNGTVTLTLLCALFILLAGCSSTSIQTEIINIPNEKWRITSLVVSKRSEVWRVSGKLNAPSIFGLPDGHVVVSILSNNKILLDQKRVEYRKIAGGASRHRKHQFGIALFAVDFESIPENANVVAEFHIDVPNTVSQTPR